MALSTQELDPLGIAHRRSVGPFVLAQRWLVVMMQGGAILAGEGQEALRAAPTVSGERTTRQRGAAHRQDAEAHHFRDEPAPEAQPVGVVPTL